MKIKDYIRLYITGFIMGTADLIPGVSGGTIAFISGIYEELLQAIKTITGPALKAALWFRLREAFGLVPFRFVVPLGLGLGTALFSLAGLLTFLLAEYPTRVWAFFFGLVLASTYIVAQRVVHWDGRDYVSFVFAAVFAYFLVGGDTVNLPHTTLITFLSGAIAICAMILPGISGSFILVLLGQYEHILASVTEFNFMTLFVFGLGTIVGISFFARFLTWLFRRHHDISVAVLSGFMLGSLRKIWPFPDFSASSLSDFWVWVLIVGGAAIVVILTRYQVIKEQTADLADPKFTQEHTAALREER